MSYSEIVNCYCFNPKCESSIFKIEKFSPVRHPISKVLSQTIFCKDCHSELTSKPILDIRSQINKSLLYGQDKLKAIFIDDDPFFHKMVKHSLKRNENIEYTKFSLNGADAIEYLKIHKNEQDVLPDLIFVDINMPVMDGWEFLEELEKLYTELPKKSRVYMTSCNILPAHTVRTRKYRFVKGLISKPFNFNTLQNLENTEFAI